MIRWVFGRLLGLVAFAVLAVAVVSPGTPLLARLLIVSIFGVSLVSAAAGLLTAALLAPLGSFIAALAGIGEFRLTEVILLSFISAWLLRPSSEHERPAGPALPRYAWIAAWFFSVLAASLAFALCRQLLRYPDALRTNLTTIALHYFGFADPTGVSDCARMLEGFAIVRATMDVFRRRPALARTLPLVLAGSASLAALSSVLLRFGIGPQAILTHEASIGYRFSAHVVDLNAAGSHFALVLCLALGMTLHERGRARAVWIAAAVASGIGLWMSGSRSAEAAAGLVLPLAFLWATTTEWPAAKRWTVIGAVFTALVAFGVVRAWHIERDPTYVASGFRQQFVMSSFRVIGTHPYLGIGVGRYYRDSPNFLTPQLAWAYGYENAHNNFLEITTEAGIIGFFVYAAFFVGALGLSFRALARSPRDWRLLGATAGIVAFLGTCLTGHPLLVPEVAAAFFFQLALVASLGGSALLNARSEVLPPPLASGQHVRLRYSGIAIVAGTIAFAVLPAWTLEKPMVPVHLEEVDGFYYGDEGAALDVPFRWTREYASIFVPANARVVSFPIRAPQSTALKEPVLVEITNGGVTLQRVLVDDKWTYVTLTLASPEPPLLFNRINFRVNHPMRISDFSHGSHDARVIGLQVGEYKIVRIAWEFVPRPAGSPAKP